MAVFTELTDEDRHSIAVAYGMTSPSSVIGIADGDRETTYFFRTKEGEFIVTLLENGAEQMELERAFATMDTLYNNNVPCPKPVRTVDGHATFQAASRLVAIVSFVSGSSTTDPNSARCRSLGCVMAQIHVVLHRHQKRPSKELPASIVHGALAPQNVFFLGDKISGVINFRLCHDDILISELADVLVGWTSQPNGQLHQRKARTLLDGYQSVRKLTNAEKTALPGFVLASAARRYASDTDKSRLPERAVHAYTSVTPEIVA